MGKEQKTETTTLFRFSRLVGPYLEKKQAKVLPHADCIPAWISL